jgi:hypothetical protein
MKLKEGLIRVGKKIPTTGAYVSKNKLELVRVEKGIKEVTRKINKLK